MTWDQEACLGQEGIEIMQSRDILKVTLGRAIQPGISLSNASNGKEVR
jgi:hypothetical protein